MSPFLEKMSLFEKKRETLKNRRFTFSFPTFNFLLSSCFLAKKKRSTLKKKTVEREEKDGTREKQTVEKNEADGSRSRFSSFTGSKTKVYCLVFTVYRFLGDQCPDIKRIFTAFILFCHKK